MIQITHYFFQTRALGSAPPRQISKRCCLNKSSVNKGVTMVEIMIATTIFTVIMSVALVGFRTFTGKASESLSKRLVLQMEARKGIVNLYRYLQEGIEVVSPPPGTTMPYLVFKDCVNNIRMVYLEEDPVKSKEEERTVFRVLTILKDPLENSPEEPKHLQPRVGAYFRPASWGQERFHPDELRTLAECERRR